jgi:phosphatidylglycerol:prolipoprotein diacylglycerol transferase
MYPIIHFFNYSIPTFGLFFLLGVGMAFLLATQTSKKYKIPCMDAMFFGIFGILGGILGAKLLYIIIIIPELLQHPENILTLLSGGSVFYGGLIGGILGGYFYTHIYHLNSLVYFDSMVPCLSLAQAFGRIGCFFNGCCYGIPYEGFGSVHYPIGSYPPSGIGLFPSQLTESLFLFILTGILLLYQNKSKTIGFTLGLYLISYGVFRFFNEFLRSDPRGSLFFFSTSQWISLFVILIGILFFMKIPQNIYNKHLTP